MNNSNTDEQRPHSLQVLHNFITAQFRFTIQSVNKVDWTFTHSKTQSFRSDHHFHLENVTLGFSFTNDLGQNILLVQTERASQVGHMRSQHSRGQKVSTTRNQFSLQVPAVNTSVTSITSSCDNVVVALFSLCNELWNSFWVVGEICIHDDDKVTCNKLQTMHVSGTQTQLASSWSQSDVLRTENINQLLGDILSSIG
ncbi:hypothetical protein CLUG_03542 [Clavispora lusitaniae ATCC 42720]|uniref:Uncharacterized protein n=1 Tax=Clavispora lusitaniae (strain ATCC 42720) TaxID=306902 RepID=C4Y5V8_CLAL4|nr:uncharacterized protein CLUG_03542 [Clavispora lusitaniae ATCC 42720]EEQ39414.1 hypothetical protein CLUG_03542 [Clavispora lusitaniae ATCC 42720]